MKETAALAHEQSACECGRPVRNERAHTCWRCRFDNDDHGFDSEGDDL